MSNRRSAQRIERKANHGKVFELVKMLEEEWGVLLPLHLAVAAHGCGCRPLPAEEKTNSRRRNDKLRANKVFCQLRLFRALNRSWPSKSQGTLSKAHL